MPSMSLGFTPPSKLSEALKILKSTSLNNKIARHFILYNIFIQYKCIMFIKERRCFTNKLLIEYLSSKKYNILPKNLKLIIRIGHILTKLPVLMKKSLPITFYKRNIATLEVIAERGLLND